MASSTFADLLAQAEEAGVTSFVPPAGEYDLEIADANGGKTKAGDPKVGLRVKIVGGPDNGKSFWTNYNFIPSNPTGLAYTFRDLAALGADGSVIAGWDPESEDYSAQVAGSLTGVKFHAKVEIKESNGYTNINLKNIKREEGIASAPAAQAAPSNRPF